MFYFCLAHTENRKQETGKPHSDSACIFMKASQDVEEERTTDVTVCLTDLAGHALLGY